MIIRRSSFGAALAAALISSATPWAHAIGVRPSVPVIKMQTPSGPARAPKRQGAGQRGRAVSQRCSVAEGKRRAARRRGVRRHKARLRSRA